MTHVAPDGRLELQLLDRLARITIAGRAGFVAEQRNVIVGKGHGFDTVKPLRLFEKIIQIWCPPDGLVLDPFAGSGTTLIAAERTSRRAALMELDPRYAQVCIDRWVAQTGGSPEQLAVEAAA